EKEMDLFFARRWLPVAREEDLPAPGAFIVRNIGAESIIITRDSDRTIRAFHNVCRHRGAELLEEEKGSTDVIQCKYHAWTYSLDGKLVGAPFMVGIEDFSMED